MLSKEKIVVLRISDHGTTGLTGVKDFRKNGCFFRFMSNGIGNDDNKRGGNNGVGKNSFFTLSSLGLVLVSTVDYETGMSGHLGKMIVSSFEDEHGLGVNKNGQPKIATNTVVYRSGEYDESEQSGNPVVPGQLDLWYSRSSDDPGTDIYIVGLDIKPEEFSEQYDRIIHEIITNFKVALDDDCLEVELVGWETLSKDTADKVVDGLKKRHGNEPSKSKWLKWLKNIENWQDLSRQEWKTYNDIVGFDNPDNSCIKFKMIECKNVVDKCFCYVTRERGMVVHQFEIKPCLFGNYMVVIQIVGDTWNSYFKNVETPDHKRFKPDRQYLSKEEFQLGCTRINKLEDFVYQVAHELVGDSVDDQAYLPYNDDDIGVDAFNNSLKSMRSSCGKCNSTKMSSSGSRAIANYMKKPSGTYGSSGNGGGTAQEHNEKSSASLKKGKKIKNYIQRVLKGCDGPIAIGSAKLGQYQIGIRIPRNSASAFICFDKEMESYNHGAHLKVKEVISATNEHNEEIECEPAITPDGIPGIRLNNVKQNDLINLRISFDVKNFCCIRVFYYEHK